MSVIPITCDNCGAKYKLPPTFKGTQAKCQKCGSVIDVAKQRAAADDGAGSPAAAKPAAARPAAAAKPAVDRSKSRPAAASSRKAAAATPKAEKPSRADKPARGSSRSRRGAKDDDGEETPRRGREKKKDNTPMIIGGVGLVAILIVVAVLMLKSDDKKDSNETAQGKTTQDQTAQDEAGKNEAGTNEPGKDANAASATDANAAKPEGVDAPDAASKPEEAAKPAEGTAPTGEATAKPAETPSTPEPADIDPTAKTERWQKQKNPPQSMGEVKTAIEMFGEVQWPASIDAAKKAEVLETVGDLDMNGGLRSIRAKAKLVEEGYAGMFGILDRLSKLDYRQSSDGAFGFELNKAIEEITGGLNAGYAAVQADEEMHPAKAYWNTKTVDAWMRTFAKWPDEEAFLANKRDRAKKNG